MARRFVLKMLTPWQDDQLPWDAALVVTELVVTGLAATGGCPPHQATAWAWSRRWRPAGR